MEAMAVIATLVVMVIFHHHLDIIIAQVVVDMEHHRLLEPIMGWQLHLLLAAVRGVHGEARVVCILWAAMEEWVVVM